MTYLKVWPGACRVERTSLAYYLCAHELFTGCRLGVKRSRVYNVNNWVETYCCKNFVACPFELRLMTFYDDIDSVYFEIPKPHLHDTTRELSKPFYSIQLFVKQNIYLPNYQLTEALHQFLAKSAEYKDIIGAKHRFYFKKLPLGRTTAFILEDLVPHSSALTAKRAYYYKQRRELRRESLEAEYGTGFISTDFMSDQELG